MSSPSRSNTRRATAVGTASICARPSVANSTRIGTPSDDVAGGHREVVGVVLADAEEVDAVLVSEGACSPTGAAAAAATANR